MDGIQTNEWRINVDPHSIIRKKLLFGKRKRNAVILVNSLRENGSGDLRKKKGRAAGRDNRYRDSDYDQVGF